MKFLFVDDSKERQRHFSFWMNENHPEHDYAQTFNGKDSIAAVQNDTYDVMYLDHDLSLETQHHLNSHDSIYRSYEDWQSSQDREITGLDVVQEILKLPKERRPKTVVVHSWNPEGSDRMMSLLRDSEIRSVRWFYRPSDLPVT